MLIDANELDNQTEVTVDLCIVGSGPAGSAIAREFANSASLRILVLEAGGAEAEPSSRDLYEGHVSGDPYQSPAESRARRLGGTACDWNTPVHGRPGAKHVPLDPIDFRQRSAVPNSGWPISYDDLAPYFKRANKVCGIGDGDYAGGSWEAPDSPVFKSPSGRMASAVYKLATAAPFIADFRGMLRESRHIDCWLHANVLKFETGDDGRHITHIEAGTLAGKRFKIHARSFVLAAGGIENPRLLLASNTRYRNGLGNEFDQVGRYFMDHPVLYGYELVPAKRASYRQCGFYDLRMVNDAAVLGRLALAAETIEKEGLLNHSLVLYPRPVGYRSRGIEALRQLRFGIWKREVSPSMVSHAANLAIGVGDVMMYAYRQKRLERIPSSHFWTRMETVADRVGSLEPEFYIEQEPDPANRVRLSSDVDALGMPRVQIDWKMSSRLWDSANRTAEIMDQELSASGWGRMLKLKYPRVKYGAHHHLGSTRMHASEKEGVVDANCQVFGLGNLFVAGSSVFTTGGYANPTLTIVALSIRLADHLKSELQRGS